MAFTWHHHSLRFTCCINSIRFDSRRQLCVVQFSLSVWHVAWSRSTSIFRQINNYKVSTAGKHFAQLVSEEQSCRQPEIRWGERQAAAWEYFIWPFWKILVSVSALTAKFSGLFCNSIDETGTVEAFLLFAAINLKATALDLGRILTAEYKCSAFLLHFGIG